MSENKTRIITLTNHVPIQIEDNEWRVLATSSYSSYSSRTEGGVVEARLFVRENNNDPRVIVNAVFSFSGSSTEESFTRRVGSILYEDQAGADRMDGPTQDYSYLTTPINSVVADLVKSLPRDYDASYISYLATECIANLPSIKV